MERIKQLERDFFGVVGYTSVKSKWEWITKNFIPKSNQVEAQVKPAKNVKDFDWLDNELETILFDMQDGNATKEQTKNRLFEVIFEDLVNEIQKLRDSSLSV